MRLFFSIYDYFVFGESRDYLVEILNFHFITLPAKPKTVY